MSTFTIKRRDTSPAMLITLLDADGAVKDFTGYTSARFHMKNAAGTTVIDEAVTVVDAGAGEVRYDFDATETATAGTFSAEVEITYADSSVETFPNSGFITVNINEDIA